MDLRPQLRPMTTMVAGRPDHPFSRDSRFQYLLRSEHLLDNGTSALVLVDNAIVMVKRSEGAIPIGRG